MDEEENVDFVGRTWSVSKRCCMPVASDFASIYPWYCWHAMARHRAQAVVACWAMHRVPSSVLLVNPDLQEMHSTIGA